MALADASVRNEAPGARGRALDQRASMAEGFVRDAAHIGYRHGIGRALPRRVVINGTRLTDLGSMRRGIPNGLALGRLYGTFPGHAGSSLSASRPRHT